MKFRFGKKNKKRKEEISYDEILLDASNLPSFDVHRMEGQMELPLSRKSIYAVGLIFLMIVTLFLLQLFKLQVIEGATYRDRSENNRLDESVIIAERGTVYDRNGELVAWNELDDSDEYNFPVRAYTDRRGLGPLIGYVSYPKKDSSGFYYRTEYLGRSGVEETYNDVLQGENGGQLVETNALGEIVSEHIARAPTPGGELTLSIDAELSEVIHDLIATTTEQNGFRSGAAAIMDVHTGELLAVSNFPSYDPEVLADGDDAAEIERLNNDERFPFLNKVTGGAYTPGSIVKPFLAYAALVEDVISPQKTIVSDGALELPNPYDPGNPTIFRDWRAHGAMTMQDAIAFSSNIYFYIIGGGLPAVAAPQAGIGELEGLGISRIHEYMRKFGLGSKTGIALSGEQRGTVPSPAWKREVFDDDWRLGDTYHTAIGQFGFQTTLIQMLRAYGAIANGGELITPQILLGEEGESIDIALDEKSLEIVRRGMRKTVVQNGGTARALERSDVAIAAKSGTAEVGQNNAFVHSWITGYFPYEEPKYAFILFMDHGPRSNTVGASSVMGKVFDWMAEHRPRYITGGDEK